MAQAGGITTANIMPGSGNVMGGQTAYVKMRGRTIDEMLIHREGVQGGMKMANGENPKRAYGSRGQAPSTRMAVAAMQRDIFIRAQAYKKKWDDHRAKIAAGTASEEPARDLELEPVVEILEGRRTVHHHTHRADDIMTVMRLAEEFGYLRNLVLQHVTEAYMVADEIARLRVPCSIIVIDAPGGKHEAAGLTLANGGLLERAGVKVAIHTDDFIVNSRFFLRAGALSVREGMSEAGALAALTINPAEMMGLADRLGSIAAGKDADLVVLSGEPFSVYTQVLQTYIDGQVVFDRSRPEDLRYATGGFAVADRYPGGESGR
jgi:imidazolonepropionase-like amidohydrolase